MKQTLMNQQMVKAILTCAKCGKMSVPVPCEFCGSTEFVKSQTRRPCRGEINEDPDAWYGLRNVSGNVWLANWNGTGQKPHEELLSFKSPFKVGEVRWVRETFHHIEQELEYVDVGCVMVPVAELCAEKIIYKVDEPDLVLKWKPSIHMPKWAARIFIKPTRVWAERCQSMSEADAKAEGVKPFTCSERDSYTVGFAGVYNSCYPKAWEDNIWNFACEFERCSKPEGE